MRAAQRQPRGVGGAKTAVRADVGRRRDFANRQIYQSDVIDRRGWSSNADAEVDVEPARFILGVAADEDVPAKPFPGTHFLRIVRGSRVEMHLCRTSAPAQLQPSRVRPRANMSPGTESKVSLD